MSHYTDNYEEDAEKNKQVDQAWKERKESKNDWNTKQPAKSEWKERGKDNE